MAKRDTGIKSSVMEKRLKADFPAWNFDVANDGTQCKVTCEYISTGMNHKTKIELTRWRSRLAYEVTREILKRVDVQYDSEMYDYNISLIG